MRSRRALGLRGPLPALLLGVAIVMGATRIGNETRLGMGALSTVAVSMRLRVFWSSTEERGVGSICVGVGMVSSTSSVDTSKLRGAGFMRISDSGNSGSEAGGEGGVSRAADMVWYGYDTNTLFLFFFELKRDQRWRGRGGGGRGRRWER